MPTGRGRVNRAGLSFYERLVDGLLASNIQPVLTLFHWDLPADLDDRGGWLNRDSAEWFAEYAAVLVRALDDRVPLWVTINEPWVIADGGYLRGVLAPGHRSRFEAPRVTHNLLRAHAAAVMAYRSLGRHHIGIVVNLEPQYPATDRPTDRAAAARADAYMNRHYLDPVLLGAYPEELREIFADAWPETADAEASAISGADRFPRRELLHAQGRARSPRRVSDGCGAGASATGSATRRWVGRSTPQASATSFAGSGSDMDRSRSM